MEQSKVNAIAKSLGFPSGSSPRGTTPSGIKSASSSNNQRTNLNRSNLAYEQARGRKDMYSGGMLLNPEENPITGVENSWDKTMTTTATHKNGTIQTLTHTSAGTESTVHVFEVPENLQ